jgi:hypothetical protein
MMTMAWTYSTMRIHADRAPDSLRAREQSQRRWPMGGAGGAGGALDIFTHIWHNILGD